MIPSPLGTPAQILLIERDPMVRTVIAEFLEEEGFDVLQAEYTPDTSLIITLQPELVILDLPSRSDLDELGCVRRLQDDPRTSHVPIVTVCRLRPSRDIPRWLSEKGIAAFLLKPFDLMVLLETIQKVLEKQPLRTHRYEDDRLNDTQPDYQAGARD